MNTLHPWQMVFDPEWAVGLVIIGIDYLLVCRRLGGRGEAVPVWRIAAFTGGLALIGVALFSPIEHLALTSMLSFHLLQNVILGEWAPPLLLLGLSLPMIAAVRSQRWIAPFLEPRVAIALWIATWYVTHIPVVYDYSLRHTAALGVEHLAFLVSGLFFWWPEIVPGVLSSVGKVVYLGVAFIAISPLDLVIYLAFHPLYGFYLHTPKLGGISALADQQIAGAAMAAEANTLIVAVMIVNLLHALAEEPEPARLPGGAV